MALAWYQAPVTCLRSFSKLMEWMIISCYFCVPPSAMSVAVVFHKLLVCAAATSACLSPTYNRLSISTPKKMGFQRSASSRRPLSIA